MPTMNGETLHERYQRETAGGFARLESAVAERNAEIARLRAEHGQACKLVADMHAAAVGEFGCGPKRGVIEDVADVRAEMLRLRAELAQARAVMLFAERVLSDLPSTNRRGTRTEAAYLRLRATIKGETT